MSDAFSSQVDTELPMLSNRMPGDIFDFAWDCTQGIVPQKLKFLSPETI